MERDPIYRNTSDELINNSRPTPRRTTPPDRDSVVEGALWMVGISIALFFLPIINGFIGGLVGGYKVGTIGRALVAAILPAIVVAVVLWVIFAIFDAPIIGFITGVAIMGWILLSDLGLFIGAAIGGAVGPTHA